MDTRHLEFSEPVYVYSPEDLKPVRKGQKLWLHILLFVATFITTTIAGAFLSSLEPEMSLVFFVRGLRFSVPLLLILGVHEMGHYIASRWHGLDATLPFFIPGPTIIGTFGAVIKIRSPLRDRDILMDVGAAGPIAGFLVALPILVFGYMHSRIVPMGACADANQLGDSLLTLLVGRLVFGPMPEGVMVLLHPAAFAAWVGLFVTSLNLIPIGRLDGGHIAYSFFGPVWNRISPFIFIVMLSLGFFWTGWLFWGLLIFLVIKIPHPKTGMDHVPIGRGRKWIFVVSALIFAVTFMPQPFRF